MHQCLQIYEIVHLICSHCHSKKDLARLARTCVTVSQPALDQLWAHLDMIDPLLDAMGPNLWDGTRHLGGYVLERKLKRPLTPQDLQAFKSRASRVLTLTHCVYTVLEAQCLAEVKKMTPREEHPLLPNLQTLCLCWYPRVGAADLDSIDLLLGPNLRVIEIGGIVLQGVETADLISNLTRQCPSLYRLGVRCGTNKIQPLLLAKALRDWACLRTLEMSNITSEVFVALSYLPHLEYLRPTFVVGPIVTVPPGGGFPVLRVLSLLDTKGADLSFFFPIIQSMNRSPLESLILVAAKASSLTQWRDTLELLTDHVNHTSLKYVTISDTRMITEEQWIAFTEEMDPLMDDPFHLHHLHNFPNIKDLSVNAYHPAEPSQKTVLNLAAHLPHLQTLAIGVFNDPPYRSTIAPRLHNLVAITSILAELTSLSLHLDVTAFDDSNPPPQPSKLRKLYVGFTPIESVDDVSAFLKGAFPHLRSVEGAIHYKNPLRSDSLSEDRARIVRKWRAVGDRFVET